MNIELREIGVANRRQRKRERERKGRASLLMRRGSLATKLPKRNWNIRARPFILAPNGSQTGTYPTLFILIEDERNYHISRDINLISTSDVDSVFRQQKNSRIIKYTLTSSSFAESRDANNAEPCSPCLSAALFISSHLYARSK